MENTSSEPKKFKITGDGSHTLYSEQFNQHYHNLNGAVAESIHIFFKANGLEDALGQREKINILEIGFGTGLNLLLLADQYLSSNAKAKIRYHSIEGFPVTGDTASSLNYAEHLQHPDVAKKLSPIIDSLEKGPNNFEIIPGIESTIFYGLFEKYHPGDLRFDFIFHDAFSPEVNPELWTGNVFMKLLQWSHPESMLSTYCAASKAKGAMAWAGWNVAKAPGALGKREMTVASPTAEPLSHLKRVNEDRLAKRYKEGDF
jgi:tRNA U34 5-methylaminomethyl-2-thiouridine-forming methyltransferase MnmC